MKEIRIDSSGMTTPSEVHELIAKELEFPSYYGANLDALYDCLTELTEEDLQIELIQPDDTSPLHGWFTRARRVFEDAAEQNSHITVIVRKCRKLAVLFPGIGYTCDRSLLYFAGRRAAAEGYQLQTVPYRDFPSGVKGDRDKMVRSFELAMEQTEEMLRETEWDACDEILFIGKSIGTIVAAAYAAQHGLRARMILFTPLADTFRFLDAGCEAIAFHGTADAWANTEEIIGACRQRNIPLHLVEHANHSLETGALMEDLANLTETMRSVELFLERSE